MAMDEAARHRLHTQLAGVLGAEPASDLMSLLPPVGWADVATKQDLTVLEHGLRIEIAELRTEFRTELGEMRNSMTRLEAKLDREVNTHCARSSTTSGPTCMTRCGGRRSVSSASWPHSAA